MNAAQAAKILAEVRCLFVSGRLKSPLVFHCATAILLAFFLSFRITVTIPIVIFLAGGFALGLFLLSPDSLFPNLLWIYNRAKKREKPVVRSCHVCGKGECGRHRSELDMQSLQPWIDLEIPEKVNEALEEFFGIVFKEYIYSWYNDISTDESFVAEMKASIRFAVSVLYRRLSKVDIPSFISNKILQLSLKHLHFCLKVIEDFEKSPPPPQPSSAVIPSDLEVLPESEVESVGDSVDVPMTASQLLRMSPSASVDLTDPTGDDLEQAILVSFGNHLHCAARTRRSELEYLKQVVEKVSLHLVPPANLKSRSFTAFMKELMTGAILLPAMDVIGDPDIINNLLLFYLDKSPLEDCRECPSPKVPILQGFSSMLTHSIQNQKNLQLKLSAVLSEPEMLFPFMQFMKAEASVNVLQFYLEIEEFNRKVLTPELTPDKLEELHCQLQKHYHNYFDPESHDCIRFDEDITEQIREICNGAPEDIIKLQTTTPLFRAYEKAYDLLEHNFLPLFHQSDIFYTMLCGERIPSKLNKGNSRGMVKRGSTADSLSRLGSKLKGVFKSNAVDGRPICDDDDDEVEQVGDPLMSEEFFLQAPNGSSTRLAESPVSIGGDDTAFLLTVPGERDQPEGGGEVQPRNLSLWVVSVPSVVIRADPSDLTNLKKHSHLFRVDVKRLVEDRESNDAFEPEEWSIERRYHEFYVLETKLKEFHGEFDDAQLPPKKTFVPKNKNFFESLRPDFEQFLRILLTKPNLRGSQLVHSFLTSDQEFTTSFIDFNLGKRVKSGAMKLVKERGQHLEPFLKSFLQSLEYQKPKTTKPADRDSDTLSISSEKMINSIYNNNANIEGLPIPICYPLDALTTTTATSTTAAEEEEGSYFDALLYLSRSVFKASDRVMELILSVRIVLRNTVDAFLDSFIAGRLDRALSERYVVRVVRMLRDALFFDNEPTRTDEDRKARQAKALEELEMYIPNFYKKMVGVANFERGIRLIFDVLQRPRLNKQLSYVLLDALLEELFPELRGLETARTPVAHGGGPPLPEATADAAGSTAQRPTKIF